MAGPFPCSRSRSRVRPSRRVAWVGMMVLAWVGRGGFGIGVAFGLKTRAGLALVFGAREVGALRPRRTGAGTSGLVRSTTLGLGKARARRGGVFSSGGLILAGAGLGRGGGGGAKTLFSGAGFSGAGAFARARGFGGIGGGGSLSATTPGPRGFGLDGAFALASVTGGFAACGWSGRLGRSRRNPRTIAPNARETRIDAPARAPRRFPIIAIYRGCGRKTAPFPRRARKAACAVPRATRPVGRSRPLV